MTRARVRHPSLAAAALLLLAPNVTLAPAARADGGPQQRVILGATPLVLKDGRMAYVSVHTVPFGPGADTLAPAATGAVATLADALATDCFLTAQAIGHVEPGAKGEGDDTLASHRLARARADRVQRLLGEKGLPASAVASVWDYQFLVREPRVTLWVFRLREGEDCKGEPLPAGKSPAVAAAERRVATKKGPPAPAGGPGPAAAAATRKVAPAVPAAGEASAAAATTSPATASVAAAGSSSSEVLRDGNDGRVAAPAAPVSPPPQPAQGAVPPTRTAPRVWQGRPLATRRSPSRHPGARSPEPGTAGEAALAEPAGGTADSVPSAVGAAGQTSAAAVPPRSATPPTAAATPPPPVGAAEIVFDTNSSFLPRGAGKELARLVARLPKARGYEVELTATVGAAADAAEAKDPAEAARYDRWLAERCLGRVAEWIEKNAPVRELSVRRGFVENDPSRRIIVRVRPVP